MNLIDHKLVFRTGLRPFETLQSEIADTDETHEFFRNQTVEGAHRLPQRDIVADLMIQIEVRIAGSEPAERPLRRTQHIVIRKMGFPDLGRQKEPGTVVSADCRADQFLRLAVGVGFRRINQGESEIQSGPQGLNLPVVVIVRIAFQTSSHLPGAHSEFRHGKTALQSLALHDRPPCF